MRVEVLEQSGEIMEKILMYGRSMDVLNGIKCLKHFDQLRSLQITAVDRPTPVTTFRARHIGR
jgi:hypothetical protein